MTGEERIASSVPLPTIFLCLHRLTDDAADGVGGGALHPLRGVGVGAEGKARVVVSQRTGQRLDIHAVLEGQRGEGVSEVVKPDVFRADGFQNFVMRSPESVRSYMVPVLGDGNRYRLQGCFLCSAISRSTACCGRANVRIEFLVFGGLTANSPLMRFTCF